MLFLKKYPFFFFLFLRSSRSFFILMLMFELYVKCTRVACLFVFFRIILEHKKEPSRG